MNALKQFFGNPVVQALIVLAAGIYILNSNSGRFLSDVSKSRDDMVASLRQAQTPEPQVAAISKGLDHLASDVHSLTLSFFSFTIVMLVATISARHRSEVPRQEPQSKIAEESRQQAAV